MARRRHAESTPNGSPHASRSSGTDANDQSRSLTFGAYLTRRWLPGKKVNLAASTYDGYRRKLERHILPTLGRVLIRRLRARMALEVLETPSLRDLRAIGLPLSSAISGSAARFGSPLIAGDLSPAERLLW